MNAKPARLLGAAAFSTSILLATSSCATREPSLPTRDEINASRAHQRLAQVNFGREATFAFCSEPACPSVTKKTLPGDPSAPRSVAAVVDPSPKALPPASRDSPEPTKVVLKELPANEATPVVPAPVVTEQAPEPSVPVSKDKVPSREDSPRAFVTFPFGSAVLSEPSKAALRRSLGHAKEADRIVISGRTDSVGDQKANEALALSRALAVREYLRDQLPDLPNIISIDARGRCCFIASNDTKDGRAKNRRVEVAFLTKGDI